MAALLPAHRQFDDPIASVALAAEEASLPTFRPRPRWDLTESIDYVPPTNAVFLAKAPPARRAAGGYTGETAAKLVITLLSGLIIGLTAVVLEAGIESGVRWRNGLLQRALLAQGLAGAARAHLGVALGATLATGAAVQWLAPGAAGSGVSLVMALLNGNNMSGLLTPAVFVVKLAGTVAGRVAGLALGPEAPMIHLGACVASLLCGIERKLSRARRADGGAPADPVFCNAGHREMVSAGAAAGMAAAFGAPIGGVLFALEEACSVWSKKTAWRCLLCAAVAVFCMGQITSTGGGLLQLRGIYAPSPRQWLWQLPLVAVVAAAGALLGGAFNVLRRRAQGLRAPRTSHLLRLLEGAGAAAATVAAAAALPAVAGRCLAVPAAWEAGRAVQYSCPAGQYNDLGTLLLGSSPWVVRSLLALGSAAEPVNELCSLALPCYFSAQSLAVLCASYLVLMVVSSGLALPGGLFMPSILCGSSLGALAGMVLAAAMPASWDIQPGVFAIVGATATLGAVFRTHLALVVIVVEGTRGIELLVGILAAVIVSNFVAHAVCPDGIYEGELESDGRVFFLRQEPPGALRWRAAGRVAASPVVGLPAVVEAAAAVRVLRETTHNGFPVTLEDAAPGAAAGAPRTLDGFILRSQLLVLLRERAFCDARGLPLRGAPGGGGGAARDEALDARMRAAAASADGLGGAREQGVDPLAHRNDMATESELTFPALDSLDSLSSLGPARFGPAAAAAATAAAAAHAAFQPAANANVNDDSRPFLDLRPFMNRAPLAVRAQTPAARAHQLFVRESLRHLCVVDAHNRVRGIITRKDLQRAGSEPAEPAARGAGGTGWAARLQAAAAPPRRALSGVWRSLSPGDAVLGDERGAAVDAATSGAGCASGGRQRRAAGLEEAGGAGEPLLGAFGSALYSDA